MTKDEIGTEIINLYPAGGEVNTMYGSGYDWEQVEAIAKHFYNLALEHAAEKALTISDGPHDRAVDKESILNLKITE